MCNRYKSVDANQCTRSPNGNTKYFGYEYVTTQHPIYYSAGIFNSEEQGTWYHESRMYAGCGTPSSTTSTKSSALMHLRVTADWPQMLILYTNVYAGSASSATTCGNLCADKLREGALGDFDKGKTIWHLASWNHYTDKCYCHPVSETSYCRSQQQYGVHYNILSMRTRVYEGTNTYPDGTDICFATKKKKYESALWLAPAKTLQMQRI